MTNKELLIQEIESLPSELLTEALDFIRFIQISHAKRQLKTDINSNSDTAQPTPTRITSCQGTDWNVYIPCVLLAANP
ncbi:hypothetical protein [Fischerella sp.]|jgi:hypothetical protein|uniref:hypothetical protein n=1 Tax=Fischerella sp. TaxID=1191 RepID=UPI0025BF3DC9|nr:hypothetical protein [Fischerella sp.]